MASTYYYVKTDGVNDGTKAAGGEAGLVSTAFDAAGDLVAVTDYYASITAVHSGNTVVAGDYVLCASTHDKDYNADTTVEFTEGVHYISVNVSAPNEYLKGAKEGTTDGAGEMRVDSANDTIITISGISFYSGDNIEFGYGANSTFYCVDVDLELVGTNSDDTVILGQLAGFTYLKNPTITLGASGQFLSAANGTNVILDNLTTAGNTTALIKPTSTAGNFKVINSDLSTITGNIVDFVNAIADACAIEIYRTKINSTASLSADSSTFCGTQTLVAHSVNVGADLDTYHYFEDHTHTGIVKEELSVFLTAGDVVEGTTTHFSAEYQPNSNVVEFSNPLSPRPLKVVAADIKAGAKTFTFEILLQQTAGAPTPLTDGNCILRAVYPDGTTQALGAEVSSSSEDVLSASSASDLTASALGAGDWTGETLGNYDFQKIAVTVPQVNEDGMDKAIIEFWLDVSTDLDTGDTLMFVDTLPVVT